jgi:hypothetical protein
MASNSIKCKANLGKIIPVALKYLIFAMQNSPQAMGHPTRAIFYSSHEIPHGSD